MANFATILTNIGLAKIGNAIALGQQIALTHMAVGDGNGAPTSPTQNQEALVNEVYRGQLNRLDIDPDNPAYVIAELVIPATEGGWYVHEVGVFDSDGDMIAVANFPMTYKPKALEGSTRDLVVRIYIEVTNAAAVQLKIDASVVLASRQWVVDNFLGLADLGKESGNVPRNSDLRTQTLADNDAAQYARESHLAALRDALRDDFQSQVNIRLIGDSITWGTGASGNSESSPRSHALTDPRNNLQAATWANLLRDYLGETYASGSVIEDAPGSGYYSREVRVFLDDDRFSYVTGAGSVLPKAFLTDSRWAYGEVLSMNAGEELVFDFYGDGFTLFYGQAPSFSDYELFLNDVSQGEFPTSGAYVSYHVEREHSFPLGQYRVRVKSVSGTFRLSGFRWNKLIRVANDGLIGTNTDEWRPGSDAGLIEGSIQNYDRWVMVMLGANDRARDEAPTAVTRTVSNIDAITDYLLDLGKRPIVMSTNDVTSDESTYNFTQREVAVSLARLAKDKGLDYVSHYWATNWLRRQGVTFLADGLHPNDMGHRAIGETVIRAIASAPAYLVREEYPPILVETKLYTFSAVPSGESIFNLEFEYTKAESGYPSIVLSAVGRIEYAGGASGAFAFSQEANPTASDIGSLGGFRSGDALLHGWVMRLIHTPVAGPNLRLGIKNLGASADVEVALRVAYLP